MKLHDNVLRAICLFEHPEPVEDGFITSPVKRVGERLAFRFDEITFTVTDENVICLLKWEGKPVAMSAQKRDGEPVDGLSFRCTEAYSLLHPDHRPVSLHFES